VVYASNETNGQKLHVISLVFNFILFEPSTSMLKEINSIKSPFFLLIIL